MLVVNIVIFALLSILAVMTLVGDTDFKLFRYIGIGFRVFLHTVYTLALLAGVIIAALIGAVIVIGIMTFKR